jgi:hypothetical protein
MLINFSATEKFSSSKGCGFAFEAKLNSQQGLYLKSDRWQPAGIFSFSIAPALPFAVKTQED